MNNVNPFQSSQSQQKPTNHFTQSIPLNTDIDNPELEYIQKEQRTSIIWHLISIMLLFVASTVIHQYGVLVVYGSVGIWIVTAVAVYLMPNEERLNIKQTKIWIIGYLLIAIIFDYIVSNLSMNITSYGLDSASMSFLSVLRLTTFIGTPVMYIGITLKRIHFNWQVRNNEKRTSGYMRQDTKDKF
jgi:hypothetical protein